MSTAGRLHPEVVIGCLHVLIRGLYGTKAQGWAWEAEPQDAQCSPNGT